MYDLRPNSVYGIVIATCNVKSQDATPTWWTDIRTLIVRTHTDHRNNVIKQCERVFEVQMAVCVCVSVIFICK